MSALRDGKMSPEATAFVRQFQAGQSWEADPGTEVVATVIGTVERRNTRTGTIHVRTPAGALVTLPADADVHVVEVQPERPTLESVLAEHIPTVWDTAGDDRMPDWVAKCSHCGTVAGPSLFQAAALREFAEHLAAELRAAGVER